jgi:leucyl aminopeptidase
MAENPRFSPRTGASFCYRLRFRANARPLANPARRRWRYRRSYFRDRLVASLPSGLYRFANEPHDATLAALSWLLSGYRFRRYKANGGELPRLCVPENVDAARIERIARAVVLGRDLINTPANDMDPDGLEAAALSLATRHHAKVAVKRGDALLDANLPLIHAVGRAAAVSRRFQLWR